MLAPLNHNEFETPCSGSVMPTEFPFSHNKPSTCQKSKFTSMIRTRGQKQSTAASNFDLTKNSRHNISLIEHHKNMGDTCMGPFKNQNDILDKFPFASQSVCEPLKRLRSEANSARGTTMKQEKRDIKGIINDLVNVTSVNMTADEYSVSSTISPNVSPRGGITSFS